MQTLTRGAPSRPFAPTALVVHEPLFRSTASVAAAVAEGLRREGFDVTCVDVDRAPALDAVDTDLLVVGAPTHVFSLTRPRTHADAVRRGACPLLAAYGVRDWLDRAEPAAHRRTAAAMFDTRVRRVRHLPRSAAARGRLVLEHLGFEVTAAPEGFLAEDLRGPPEAGEVERARAWGARLARVGQGAGARVGTRIGARDRSYAAAGVVYSRR